MLPYYILFCIVVSLDVSTLKVFVVVFCFVVKPFLLLLLFAVKKGSRKGENS